MAKSAPALRVSGEDREWLEALIRSGKTPQRVALRARLVLGSAAGRANHALARELGISRPTVLLWRQRYRDARVAGLLKDARRPGRKKRMRQAHNLRISAIVITPIARSRSPKSADRDRSAATLGRRSGVELLLARV